MSAPIRTAQPGKMPQGVRMSPVWRLHDGTVVEGADGVEVPVDAKLRIAGYLWVCQDEGCPTVVWVYDLDPAVRPEQRYCTVHGVELVPSPVDGGDPDPVSAARSRTTGKLRGIIARRRDAAVQAAQQRAQALRAEAEKAARRQAAEFRGHVPSVAVSSAALLTGVWVTAVGGPMVAAATGAVTATFGAVVAYVACYVAQRWTQREGDAAGKWGRRARARARHIASGVLALGVWLLAAAALGVDPGTWAGDVSLLSGAALIWMVNRTHWDGLWAERRRLAELARLAAEEAARRAAEEAARLAALANSRPPLVLDDDLLEVGRRMAAEWERISRSPTVPAGFPMARTWIVPEETRENTVGYEFAIHCEPGALVARAGSKPPLVAAREWLADMLPRDRSTVELVDRPESQPNRGLLILTNGAPLGGAVPWKGRDGVRHDDDGAIYVHNGRSLKGDDVEEAIYVPGQAGGGLVVGTTGGGKTAGVILDLLNCLVAGLFPTLFDPKELVDYGDFVGVFPIGVTTEHRDVILQSKAAERSRRQKLLARRPAEDRFGRKRRGESIWNLADGPPMADFWEEFHDLARDDKFVNRLTNHIRFQRVAAMWAKLITQGGGLADLNNSVLRALLNQTSLTTYRTDDHQSRLAGSRDATYSAADLPRAPGVCLVQSPTSPAMPLRRAFVHREDRDGSVFDQLYGPNMEPLLTAPALPPETLEVFEREGLMDLWRLGQGEDGLDRLLSDTNTPDVTTLPTGTVMTDGGDKFSAADTILGIVFSRSQSTCTRSDVDTHEGWKAAGWAKPPVGSTITRAANQLEKDGLLSRADGQWRVLPAGEARAGLALAVMLQVAGAGKATEQPAGEPTEADKERAAEMWAEEQDAPA